MKPLAVSVFTLIKTILLCQYIIFEIHRRATSLTQVSQELKELKFRNCLLSRFTIS